MVENADKWLEEEDLDDYGIGGRMNALIHTFTEDFQILTGFFPNEIETQTEKILLTKPRVLKKQGLTSFEAEQLSLYAAGHEGAHILFTDQQATKEAISFICSKKDLDYDLFGDLIQITEDARVDYLILKERPGFIDLKYHGAKGLLRCLCNRTENKEHAGIKSLTALMYGIDLRKSGKGSWDHVDWIKIEKMADFIKASIPKVGNSSESVFLAYEVYRGLYGEPIEALAGESEDIIRGRPGTELAKKKKESIRKIEEKVNSEVLTQLIEQKKLNQMKDDLKEYRQKRRLAKDNLDNLLANELTESVNAFGPQIITDEEKRRLEKAYALGIHARIPIHVCRGKISEELSKKRYQLLQQDKKLSMQVEELTRRIKVLVLPHNGQI